MLEIIGVIALVALISLVGISMISKLMAKQKANRVVEEAKSVGFLFVADYIQRINIEEHHDVSSLLSIETVYPSILMKETETSFAFIALDVPYNVCAEIKKFDLTWIEEIIINEDTDCTKEPNNIAFYINTEFNSELSLEERICTEDVSCGVCGYCENRLCFYDQGEVRSGNSCVPCDKKGNINQATKETCILCHNRFFQSIYNICYECDLKTGSAYTYFDDCSRCPNRYWVGQSAGYGMCALCPEGGSVDMSKKFCDYDCGDSRFLSSQSGECESCSSAPAVISSKEVCNGCPEGTRFWQYNYTKCFPCNEKKGIAYTSKDECMRCPNRYFIGTYEPSGTCAMCPEGSVVNEDHTLCTNECNNGMFLNPETGDCESCTATANFTSNQSECNKCPLGTRFWQYNYTKCYPCNEKKGIAYTSRDECLRCPNRYFIGTYEPSGTCAICPEGGSINDGKSSCTYTCGEDEFFNPAIGQCSPCSLSDAVISAQDGCNVCQNSRFWQYNYTKCFSCNDATAVSYVSKDECLRCPNRYWTGTVLYSGKCSICNGTVSEDGMSCITE